MIDLAWKMVRDDVPRSTATVAGVAFAVALVYVQTGIFLGMLDSASVTIERLDADLWIMARDAANVDFANTFPEGYVARVRSVPGVARADNLIVWFVTVALPTGAKESALVYAMEDFRRWDYPWDVTAGDPADLRRGRFVILDESARRRFGRFEVGDYREFLGLRLKVIGRSRGARSFTTNPLAFVDYRVAQALLPQELRGRTTYIVARLEPWADAAAVRAEIARRLPHNDVRTRAEWAARSRAYWVESTGLGLSMITTVGLGALVGVVVVAQTLYTSTIEHAREFATIKAIGGRDRDVYRVIFQQAALAAVAGFLAGAVLAHAAKPVLEGIDLKVILPPELALDVFAGTFVLCLAAAAASFRRLARLDPAIVFRA